MRFGDRSGIGHGGGMLPLFFEVFDTLFLFPEDVLHLLVIIELGIDAYVGVVPDRVAGDAIGFGVAGGMVADAIQFDILLEQNGIEGDDLFLGKVEHSFLHSFQLVDGPLSGQGRLVDGGGVGNAGLGVGSDPTDYCVG